MKIAVQMDHISTLNIESDTTLALCLEAQKREYLLFHYLPDDLVYEDGEIFAKVESMIIKDNKKNFFELGEPKFVNLSLMDIILMRQEPPFNMNYITYTHLLEHLSKKTKVINNPVSVRNAPEKLLVTCFNELMPPTIITRNLGSINSFLETYQEIVIKPLYGKGGEGIIRARADSDDILKVIKEYLFTEKEPIMIQPFLPEVTKGDKRIILIKGEPVGCLNRIPAEGEFRSNLGVGGQPELSALNKSDKKICESIKGTLMHMDLFFVGIDVIGKYLTEINVTCPTGVRQIKNLGGPDIAKIFWDKLENST
ncbi:MAG: glutathione synthase [Pseudomonadota bacterium]|nr:glutathione synthase [Pseudomonadota bacterium]